MGVCDVKKIKQNIKRCGQKALSKGVEDMIYLAMRDDQEVAFSFDPANPTIVTAIAMKVGEKLYAYQGNNFSNDFSVGFAESDYDSTLPQTGVIIIFSNSPATKLEIEALLTRKDLIVITKRQGGGDYEIYGVETGMRRSGFTYRPNDDNKGAFVITLAAPDETSLPKTLRHSATVGGVDDTKTYLATLIAADV